MKWLKLLLQPRGGATNDSSTASARIAKERLQVIVAHQKNDQNDPDMMNKLQKEIVTVLAKYVKIDEKHVEVGYEKQGDRTVLELNITIPEQELPTTKPESGKKSTTKKTKSA